MLKILGPLLKECFYIWCSIVSKAPCHNVCNHFSIPSHFDLRWNDETVYIILLMQVHIDTLQLLQATFGKRASYVFQVYKISNLYPFFHFCVKSTIYPCCMFYHFYWVTGYFFVSLSDQKARQTGHILVEPIGKNRFCIFSLRWELFHNTT